MKSDEIRMRSVYSARVSGKSVAVRVVALEYVGRGRYLYTCRNLETGRRVSRTAGQLRPLVSPRVPVWEHIPGPNADIETLGVFSLKAS